MGNAAKSKAFTGRRLMTAAEAAEYLGSIPVTEVRRLGVGRVGLGRHVRYDRMAIDAFLDRVSNPQASPGPAAGEAHLDNDDADAALARFEAPWKD